MFGRPADFPVINMYQQQINPEVGFMRRIMAIITTLCMAAMLCVPASAEDGVTRISDIFDIGEPTGMAYISAGGDYCDLFPMDNEPGSHEAGTELYWAIWNVLGSAPLYAAGLPAGEIAAPLRTSIPAREESCGAFRVESGEDFLTAEIYDGWNLLYITLQRGGEPLDAGWHIVLSEGDMDVLNAVSAIYED